VPTKTLIAKKEHVGTNYKISKKCQNLRTPKKQQTTEKQLNSQIYQQNYSKERES